MGTPIRPQQRAQEVGQNISAKLCPNWYANTAIERLIPTSSAVGAKIGIVIVAALVEPLIKSFTMFSIMIIP